MTEEPTVPTVAVVPLKEITDVVPDEQMKAPGVLGVGAVSEKFPEPTNLETFAQVNVGVALDTVIDNAREEEL